MQKIATLISYVFQPLLMATYGCLLVFFGLYTSIYAVYTPFKTKLAIILTVVVFTYFIPVLNLVILYKLKYISSLRMEIRQERVFPLVMTALCYLGLFYLIYDFNIWPAIKLFILGGGTCILLAAIITIWWQISAHLIGIGGVVGVLLALCYYMQMPIFIPISGCILLAGIIGFARLQLKVHSPTQIYVGFLVGCIVQFGLFSLAQQFRFL